MGAEDRWESTMTRGAKSILLAALLAFINLAGCGAAANEGVTTDAGLRLSVRLSVADRSYTVNLENVSDHVVRIWDHYTADGDSIMGGKELPASGQVKDPNGMIISSTKDTDLSWPDHHYHNEWWPDYSYRSELISLPVPMREMKPGQRIEWRGDIKTVCQQIWGGDEIDFDKWVVGKSIKLRAVVFHTDPNMGQSVTAETAFCSLGKE